MEDSFKAEYALLNAISARQYAIETRLRNSQPLLWAGSALSLRRPTASSYEKLDDENPIPVEERAWRRRIEWEVTRRIARVEREMHKLPPTQRYWHPRRQTDRIPFSDRQVRQSLASIAKQNKSTLYTQQRAPAINTGNAAVSSAGNFKIKQKSQQLPLALDIDRAHRPSRSIKHNDSQIKSTLMKQYLKPRMKRVDSLVANGKENQIPNEEAVQPQVCEMKKEELRGANTSQHYEKTELRETKVERPNKSSVELASADSPIVNRTSLEINIEPANLSLSAVGGVDRGIDSPDSDTAGEHNMGIDQELVKSNQHTDIKGKEAHVERRTETNIPHSSLITRPTSAIGRQILSDFRTMPSVASFGAPPTFPSAHGNRSQRRLNSDVLRRLFSDLDTDHDGRLNRIETCIALHRLQLSVPATTVRAFFRRLNSVTVNSNDQSHNEQHRHKRTRHRNLCDEPMYELINYKQFIAFVTTAYEKHQQLRHQPSHTELKAEIDTKKHVDGAKITCMSSLQPSSSPIQKPKMSKLNSPSYQCAAPQQQVRRYEYDGGDVKHNSAAYEEQILRHIPDYLVGQVLSDPMNHQHREPETISTMDIVRKSLEKLASGELVNDKVLREITLRLIQEHLKKGDIEIDKSCDMTGLQRAAAYYDQQGIPEENQESEVTLDDNNLNISVDAWLSILTEEQVAGLVKEIWKERRGTLQTEQKREDEFESDVAGDRVRDVNDSIDDENEQNLPQLFMNTQGEIADHISDAASAHVDMVAEKAVQTTEKEEFHWDGAPMILTDGERIQQESIHQEAAITANDHWKKPMRTNLGRAIWMVSSRFIEEEPSKQGETKLCVSALDTLRQYRWERMRSQNIHTTRVQTKKDPDGSSLSYEDSDHLHGLISSFSIGEEENALNIMNTALDHASCLEAHTDEKNGKQYKNADQPSMLTEKTIITNEFITRNHNTSDSLGIDGDLISSTDVGNAWESDSSNRKSFCSEDLSEGGIEVGGSLNLSDGEVYGKDRQRLLRWKKSLPRVFAERIVSDTTGDNDTKSSVESGELLSMKLYTKLRTNFQEPLDSSCSSYESGELENGLLL